VLFLEIGLLLLLPFRVLNGRVHQVAHPASMNCSRILLYDAFREWMVVLAPLRDNRKTQAGVAFSQFKARESLETTGPLVLLYLRSSGL
jgi:hypothetical protein